MNKNLEQIIEEIMSALDIINEYGSYVDEYVKQQRNPTLYNIEVIAQNAKKLMFFKANKDMVMRMLDSAIKKFTELNIILSVEESLKELGYDINEYIDGLDEEKIKIGIMNLLKTVDLKQIVKNINPDDFRKALIQLQTMGER